MTDPGASPLEHAGPRFLMRPGGVAVRKARVRSFRELSAR